MEGKEAERDEREGNSQQDAGGGEMSKLPPGGDLEGNTRERRREELHTGIPCVVVRRLLPVLRDLRDGGGFFAPSSALLPKEIKKASSVAIHLACV